ncbi:MAG: DUF3160 domain-containing protein [Anaerolineales bacterium]|nr:DUF3160 domain-containing protein [Anaerolineales bacterium]
MGDRRPLLPLLSLLLLALACQLSGGSVTPVPTSPLQVVATATPAGPTDPLDGTALTDIPRAPLSLFASWAPPEIRDLPGSAATDPFPAPNAINNPADLWPLNQAQQTQLFTQGYILQPPDERFFQDIYLEAAADGRPIFITPDLILHTTSLVLADSWAEVENGQLRDDLAVLVRSLREAAETGWAGLPAADQAALNQLIAYFAVAELLLNPAQPAPEPVATLVNEELILIRQGEGVFLSPLLRQARDYSLFQPPAGYAGTPERAAFYQAATWLSQTPWTLADPPAEARQHGLALLMLLSTLERSQNWTRWERIVTAQGFFQGQPTGWTLADYAAVARALYDGRLPDATQLAERHRLDSFLLTVTGGGATAPQVLHFRPVATHSDTAILTGLTFNRVGLFTGDPGNPPVSAASTEVGLIRAFPLALDVAAAYGSAEAAQLLAAAGDDQYEGYLAQRQQLAVMGDAAARTLTLNDTWLYALEPLLTAPGGAAPRFMTNAGWQQLRLAGWVGGWTETRRDLAATRYQLADPAIFQLDAAALPAAGAYLAPEPALYARLAAVVAQLRGGLSARGLLSAATAARLTALGAALNRLQALSEQELAGIPLRPDEARYLRQIVPELLGLTVTEAGAASEVALISTLYSDANSGQQWQVGLGAVAPIYVLVPDEDGYTVAVGGVNSVYGLARPAGAPLTNAAWLLGNRPDPAPWWATLTTP